MTKVESEPESGKVYKNEYEYEEDRLKKVKHNTTGSGSDVEYRFEYDGLGRKQAVYVGEQKLSENVYGEDPVSYTHLDVYKRQALRTPSECPRA